MVRANLHASGLERTRLVERIAEISGNPHDACYRFAQGLGLRKRDYRNWSAKDDQTLRIYIETSEPLRIIAAKMRRSRSSVGRRMRYLGVSAKLCRDSFGKYKLAELLHVRPGVLQRWIDTGLLPARIDGTELRRRYTILAEDFRAFCEQHPNALLQGHVRKDRLEFLFKFVFPRSHADLLPVRDAKKERAAYQAQMERRENKIPLESEADDWDFEDDAAA